MKEKLILTVLNLLIQTICHRASLHMVLHHLIFTGCCFSKHYSKALFAPNVIGDTELLNAAFKIPQVSKSHADVAKLHRLLKANYSLFYWQNVLIKSLTESVYSRERKACCQSSGFTHSNKRQVYQKIDHPVERNL